MTLQNPYCTLSAVQQEASNKDAEDVDLFKDKINQVSRWIDSHCRRDFLFHDHSSAALAVKRKWAIANRIWLPFPIITLDSISIDGTDVDATSYSFESTDRSSFIEAKFIWAPDTSGTEFGVTPSQSFSVFPTILMKGTFGYAEDSSSPLTAPSPDIPQEISEACAVIAAIRSGKVHRAVVAHGGEVNHVTIRSIPKQVMESLKAFRRVIT